MNKIQNKCLKIKQKNQRHLLAGKFTQVKKQIKVKVDLFLEDREPGFFSFNLKNTEF